MHLCFCQIEIESEIVESGEFNDSFYFSCACVWERGSHHACTLSICKIKICVLVLMLEIESERRLSRLKSLNSEQPLHATEFRTNNFFSPLSIPMVFFLPFIVDVIWHTRTRESMQLKKWLVLCRPSRKTWYTTRLILLGPQK